MNEPNPCPRCECHIIKLDGIEHSYRYSCTNCGRQSRWYNSELEALVAWNFPNRSDFIFDIACLERNLV